MKTPKPLLFLFILFLLLLTTLNPLSIHASQLSLTVSPGKTSYNLNENTHIYANLTGPGGPIKNGLVALQIDNPQGWPIIYRTLQTNTPPKAAQLKILNVTPCDQSRKPQNSFKKGFGTLAWFQIYYNYTSPVNVTFTFTIYDNETVPLGEPIENEAWLYVPGVYSACFPMPIPNYASIETAKVYVNAYTDRPKLGGVPYCPEVSASFKITGTQTSTPPMYAEPSKVTGPYNTTFKLSTKANHKIGNYTAYVSSSYQEQKAYNSITFKVKCLQDISGPGGKKDGKVSLADILVLAFPGVYGSQKGDPLYKPEYDIASPGKIGVPDGKITLVDILAIAAPGVYGYNSADP